MMRIAYAPLLAAGLIGGMVAFTPTTVATLASGPTSTAVDPSYPISANTGAPLGDAGTGTDPLVPYGTLPQAPVTLGYINRNHDEGVTSNGQVDVPF
jgi:hypothetical protein